MPILISLFAQYFGARVDRMQTEFCQICRPGLMYRNILALVRGTELSLIVILISIVLNNTLLS
jgi:hypothetical protein